MLEFRLFMWQISLFRLFAWRYCVFSHGVISSFRMASFCFSRSFISGRKDEMAQTSRHKLANLDRIVHVVSFGIGESSIRFWGRSD